MRSPPPVPPASALWRSRQAAKASTAAPTQTGSNAHAKAAPTNHPAIQKVHCGTARVELRRDQADRRVGTHSPAPSPFPFLLTARPRTKSRSPRSHLSVLGLSVLLPLKH